MSRSEIKQQFEPSVKAATDAIDDIIERLKISQAKLPQVCILQPTISFRTLISVKVIIIGGGASAFPYFLDSLVNRYEKSGSSPYISVKRAQEL
jgi:hypothetical protein